ncbi:hypothetical protein BGZ49_006359 [Haplosporangium sp. Z 27]|nr:hypothetical protein BGZ49_006359 [Haplosporangium sp. Z 27]
MQPSKDSDSRKENLLSFSPNTINARDAKTSIPDLISEEEHHVEDEEVDVIRLAQHRPYLQQSQYQFKLEDQGQRLHNSGNISSTNINIGTSSTSVVGRSNTVSSAGGPTKRRMLVVAVVIPPIKKVVYEEPRPDPAASRQKDSPEPVALAEEIPLAKKTQKFFTKEQRTKLEAYFLVNPSPSKDTYKEIALDICETTNRVWIASWFRKRRQKTRIGDEAGSAGSTPRTSPVNSPVLSGRVDEKVEEAMSEAESDDSSTQESREGTPGEGNLGSSSVRYRSYTAPSTLNPSTRGSTSTNSQDKTLSGLMRQITPLLRGGSIASPLGIDPLVDLMSKTDEPAGKKIILNALLSTQSRAILDRFVQTDGLNIIRRWIDDSRNNPHSPQRQEILLTIIRVLKALPFNSTTLKGSLKGAIVLIVGDRDSTHEIASNASELLQKWSNFTEGVSRNKLRSPRVDKSISAKKRSGFEVPPRQSTVVQEVPQLPRFKLKSPTASSQPRVASQAPVTTQIRHVAKEEDSRPRQDLLSSAQARTTILPSRPLTTINFDPLASQHNKAMEALRKQQKKIKTVRFKDDTELQTIRYFEKDSDGDDSASADDQESGTESFDDDEPSYSYSKQILPSISSFQKVPPSDNLPVVRHFLMPDNVMKDFIEGTFWLPPQPLDNISMSQSDSNLPGAANGEESTEKYRQAEREAQLPPVIYYATSDIPMSPAEPDPEPESEMSAHCDPKIMPLFSREADHVAVLLQTLTSVYQIVMKNNHL